MLWDDAVQLAGVVMKALAGLKRHKRVVAGTMQGNDPAEDRIDNFTDRGVEHGGR